LKYTESANDLRRFLVDEDNGDAPMDEPVFPRMIDAHRTMSLTLPSMQQLMDGDFSKSQLGNNQLLVLTVMRAMVSGPGSGGRE
jgi:hypothetical protein